MGTATATRQKKAVMIGIGDWDEADECLEELGKIDAIISKEEAEYNAKEQERRQVIITKHAPLKAKKEELELYLKNFVMAHKADFGDKKSKTLPNGEVSLKLSPPAIIKNKRLSWAEVLEMIKGTAKFAKMFIRKTENINKPAVISAYQSKQITDAELIKYGMSIEQKENFAYKLKTALGG